MNILNTSVLRGAIVEERLSRFVSYGLTAGSTPRITAQAYDRSGNVGPESGGQAALGGVALSSSSPARDEQSGYVTEVAASFNITVEQATLRVVDAKGNAVAGSSQPFTVVNADAVAEAALNNTPDALLPLETIGARFAPAAGRLLPGVYTATIEALDPRSQQREAVSWSFEVIEKNWRSYMPLFPQQTRPGSIPLAEATPRRLEVQRAL